ncbi:MAG: hypothetical protein QW279_09475, partial [Candidatus Jordarchaeaceae archaeon]
METFRKGKRTRKVLILAVVLLVAAMVTVVPAQGQNLVANPLIYQSLLPPVNSFTDPSTLVKAVVWGEKIVTGTEAYSNMEIILNGPLMVENGGSL